MSTIPENDLSLLIGYTERCIDIAGGHCEPEDIPALAHEGAFWTPATAAAFLSRPAVSIQSAALALCGWPRTDPATRAAILRHGILLSRDGEPMHRESSALALYRHLTECAEQPGADPARVSIHVNTGAVVAWTRGHTLVCEPFLGVMRVMYPDPVERRAAAALEGLSDGPVRLLCAMATRGRVTRREAAELLACSPETIRGYVACLRVLGLCESSRKGSQLTDIGHYAAHIVRETKPEVWGKINSM